ncbi:MAG: right-handed parallel beta-helix repeat-containing protein [Clostridia bacterium]|nr:right-handed parallel beta-helix repeat-containing protein [Clostridia bacterium]
MKKTVSLFAALIMLFACLALPSGFTAFAANENALYVSPDGEGDGSLDAPMSFSDAKEKLKALPGDEAYTVYLRGGRYVFDETVFFTEADRPNVSFEAYKNEEVVFTGAKEITGFSEGEANGVKVFTKQLDTSKENWYFKSLFSDKGRLTVPRYPESGYYTVKDLCPEDDIWTPDTAEWEFCLGQTTFIISDDDSPENFTCPSDVNVRILHYWHDELSFIKDYDKNTGKLTLSRPSSMIIRNIDRYYYENVFEGLNAPGEWYLNRETGMLYYVPQEGEKAADLKLYGSSLECLININGVSGIGFKGVRFTETDWNMTDVSGLGGWHSQYDIDTSQAAINTKGVFTVSHAENVRIENCEFIALGAAGVKLMDGVKNSSVENCYFEDIAATGIFIGGKNCKPDEEDYTSGITVRNNEIYKYGQKFFGAIGIHITYCDTAEIVNNEIHDGYYTGISCGWIWGYAYHATKNIKISRNLIYNIGQGWLSDMGGIYMLGIQPGTVLSENVIHNVAADPGEGGYGGWGIYLDEGSSDMTVEKNLVFRCGSQGLNIHYGEGNVFSSNISALNAEGQVSTGSRNEDHATAFYYNNIFVTDGGAPIYVYMQNTGHFYENGNLMWSLSDGDDLKFGVNNSTYIGLSAAKKQGFLHNVTVKDPLFTDIEHYDFTLRDDSPAKELSFLEWDYSAAGTLKNSVIGLSREGGKTVFSEGVKEYDYVPVKNAGGIRAIMRTALGLLCAVCILAAVIKLLLEAKRKSALMLLISGALAVLAYMTYRTFVNWSPALYVVFSILFCVVLAAAGTAVGKQTRTKKAVVGFVVRFAVCYAGFFAVVLILNNVMRIGEAPAIFTVLTLGFIYELYITAVYIANSTNTSVNAKENNNE